MFKKRVKFRISGSNEIQIGYLVKDSGYKNKFKVPQKNILVIPNFLPRWWIGEIFDIDRITKRYDEMKSRKPRICFPASTTHYDIFKRNGLVDDFTHVNDFVRSTADEYDWTFIGGIPEQLKDLVNDKKIKYVVGFDLFNYPRELSCLNQDLIIAPLQNNIFNRCKSNIKFTESSAMGIPGIFQNLEPYRKYTNFLFNSCNELQNQIDLVLSSKEKYLDIVRMNRNIVDNGDSNSPNGWWLEKNIMIWLEFCQIMQRTLTADLSSEVMKKYNELKSGQIQLNPEIKTISI